MKLSLKTNGDSPQRRMWRALSGHQRAFAVAAGIYRLDDKGKPILDGEMLCKSMRDIERAMGEGAAR